VRITHVLKGGDREFINGGNYDPVYTNCEQFATFLVFGEKLSVQTDHLSQVFKEKNLWEDLGGCLIVYWVLYFVFKSQLWNLFVQTYLLPNGDILEAVTSWPIENPMKINVGIVMLVLWYMFFYLKLLDSPPEIEYEKVKDT